MNLIKLLCGLLLLSFVAKAQIVIDESALPKVGDTLSYFIQNSPQGIDLGTPGTGQTWDFGDQNSQLLQRNVYSQPQFGMAQIFFPNADLLIKGNAGLETYFHADSEGLFEIGLFGEAPLNLGINVVGRYSENGHILRKTPFSFGSTYNQSSALCFPISADELPDTIISLIPFPIDSLRFCTERQVEMQADAEGNLKLNGENFDVLRLKVNETSQLKIEVKVSIFDWSDVTSLLGENPLFEPVLSKRYDFISPNYAQNVSTIYLDSLDQTIRMYYIASDNITALNGIRNGRPAVVAYPNPSFGQVNFACHNLESGWYTLKVFNIIGKVLWEEDYFIEKNKTIKVDLAHLKKGSYLYSLSEQKGKTLSSKRLIIIKP